MVPSLLFPLGVDRVAVRIFILIFSMLITSPALAKKVTKPKKRNPVPKALYQRPTHLLTDDQFYSKYFGKNDSSLKESYKAPEALPASEEGRESLANGVLRNRLRNTFETYLREMKPPKSVTRVQRTLEKAKNYAIPVGGKSSGGSSGRFVVGYDIFTDQSKFEYLGGVFETGVYHSNFSRAFVGQDDRWSSAYLNVNTNIGVAAPRAEFSYPFSGEFLQTTVKKRLSESMEAAVSKKQPIHMPDYQHFYEFRLQYNF